MVLKEEIARRHTDYIDLLKRELAMSKTIIANPRKREQAFLSMNFDKVEF